LARLFVHISHETEVFAKTRAASVLSVHRLVRWVAEVPGVLSRNQEYVDGQEKPVMPNPITVVPGAGTRTP
jgi:hypothetical protein